MKRYLTAGLIATLISIALGYLIIPLLKKFKFNQSILGYVENHKNKSGTPTMGGIFFIIAIVLTFFIFKKGFSKISTMALTISLGFFTIGFLDDFIKIKFKRNLGLTPMQKTFFMLIVAIVASVFSYRQGLDFVYLPFFNKTVFLGFFSIILNILVFIATVNGVNLTDGLDGLCSSVSVIVFLSFAFIINLQTTLNAEVYFAVEEYENLTLLSVVFVGALLGYLLFNVNKATVFMGDTGSLAIGGAISSIAIFSGNTLYLPFIGITFVVSVLSVIIQVLYYKKTKNRVFKMAPYHHHLQLIGKTEWQISYAYTLITVIISVFLIIFIMR